MKTRFFQTIIPAFLLTIFSYACQNSSPDDHQTESETTTEVPSATTEADNELLNWQAFVSDDYQLALQYPNDWMLIENNNLPNDKAVINVFPAGETVDTSTYSETHGDNGFSYLAIYPHGVDRSLPWGKSMTFAEARIPLPEWTFAVNEATSRVLQLEDGKVWGYYIQPASLPTTWSDNGFIFVQYSIENFQASCINTSTGEEKEMANCKLEDGYELRRRGTVNTGEAYLMNNVLETLKLGNTNS